MGVLNKLIIKNLRMNKQRTIVSIIGIILSCALITALFSLVVSFQESLKLGALKNDGHRHVTFCDVPRDLVKDITEHKEVKSFYLLSLQSAKIEDGFVGVNRVIGENGVEDLKNQLVEGSVPRSPLEVVVDIDYQDKYDVHIGDMLTVNTGNRYYNGEFLNDHMGKVCNDQGDLLESFEVTDTQNFKVVGIAKQFAFLRSEYDYNMYTIGDQINDTANVFVWYDHLQNYQDITNDINGALEDGSGGKYDVDYNSAYLQWCGLGLSNGINNTLVGMASIITFIILFVSVFCIRNSFAISVSEKTKLYGMLSSVGATPRQIKMSVLKEGFYLGVMGIPLGVCFGILACFVLIRLVGYFMTQNGSLLSDFVLNVSWQAIIGSVVLASITIYLSSIGSARKASKITEIEAIKNNNQIVIKSGKMKTPKIIRQLFKVGGVFAYKNMKRNRSQYRTTVIALVVSISSFISAFYFMDLGGYVNGKIFQDMSFTISVQISNSQIHGEDENRRILNEIGQLDHVDAFSVVQTKQLLFDKQYFDDGFDDNVYDTSSYATIVSVSEAEYQRYLEKTHMDEETVKNKGILISNTFTKNLEDGEKYLQHIIREETEVIQLFNKENGYILNLELLKSDIYPMGMENYLDQPLPVILVSEENFYKMDTLNDVSSIYIQSNNGRAFMKALDYYEKNLSVSLYRVNIEELIEAQNNIIIMMGIFFYGFIGVITLIGLTNMFNTITTNMMLRSREFAILKSIGMTKKEFKNMIRLESIFYGTKSLIWGTIFGVGLSYLMYSVSVSNGTILLEGFVLPYKAIGISIVFVFLIIQLIMNYSLSKINKQNIIETITNTNI